MSKFGKSEIRLGKMELRIMTVVWERGKATVHDVKDALSRGRKPAYTTVLTMMRRLEAKGYLKHDVEGRTYVYHPTVSRRTIRRHLLGEFVERVFEGSARLLVTSLIEESRISPKELREIHKLIRERSDKDE